jgi:hypothetical protein
MLGIAAMTDETEASFPAEDNALCRCFRAR